MRTKFCLVLSILLSAVALIAYAQTPPTNIYGENYFANNSQPVSPLGQARIRYNSGTNLFEQSLNGAGYTPLTIIGLYGAYKSSASTADNVILETIARGPVVVRDGSIALTAALDVTDSTGNTHFLQVGVTPGGPQLFGPFNFGATPSAGYGFQTSNTTAATAGTPVQASPDFVLGGQVWNGAASAAAQYQQWAGATTTGSTSFATAWHLTPFRNGAAGADSMVVSFDGTTQKWSYQPGTNIANISQGATNTTGLLFQSDVAAGGTSMPFVFNAKTFPGSTQDAIQLQLNGVDRGGMGFYVAGSGFVLSGPGVGNEYMSIDGAVTGFQWVVGGTSKAFLDATSFRGTTESLGDAANLWIATYSTRYLASSSNLVFSATPAFNCTTNEVQHIGTITGNVTGATMTSGAVGERCTVMFLKDATANAYTIVYSGTNVRTQGTVTMSTTASSITSMSFRWDDRLATPAWIQEASALNGL